MSPYDMNLAKGLFGSLYLALALACVGTAPVGAGEFLSLGLSGIIGIALGDSCYFVSLINLGPRLATLLGTLSPLLTAVLAGIFLSEKPSLAAWAGISIAVGAVAWVMADGRSLVARSHGNWMKGVRHGLVAALCTALGTVLAKKGAAGTLALEAALIRIICGLGALILWGAAQGRMKGSLAILCRPGRFLRLNLIVLIVTFGGFWLSIRALQQADAWLVSLCLTTIPLLIIPMTAVMCGEQIRWKAVLGTAIVVGAVALALTS